MMKSQLFYIHNFTMVKVSLFYWWCCVCYIVLLTLCIYIYILRARHDHNKIAPCGMIKVFLNWIEYSLRWQPFYSVQLNAHDSELAPFLVHSPSDVGLSASFFFFLLTQANKRQRTHLGNSVYRKRRRKHFRTLFCAMYPYAYWRTTTREAGQTTHSTEQRKQLK